MYKHIFIIKNYNYINSFLFSEMGDRKSGKSVHGDRVNLYFFNLLFFYFIQLYNLIYLYNFVSLEWHGRSKERNIFTAIYTSTSARGATTIANATVTTTTSLTTTISAIIILQEWIICIQCDWYYYTYYLNCKLKYNWNWKCELLFKFNLILYIQFKHNYSFNVIK